MLNLTATETGMLCRISEDDHHQEFIETSLSNALAHTLHVTVLCAKRYSAAALRSSVALWTKFWHSPEVSSRWFLDNNNGKTDPVNLPQTWLYWMSASTESAGGCTGTHRKFVNADSTVVSPLALFSALCWKSDWISLTTKLERRRVNRYFTLFILVWGGWS